jgi:prepilin-type N-terminal cleavage/methylation domain-containing protein
MKKGFTLVEILMVIAIIAIIAVIAIPSMLGVRAKARDAQRMQDLKAIASLVQYNALQNTLPTTLTTGCIYDSDSTGVLEAGMVNSGLGKFIRQNLESFKGIFPKDPLGRRDFYPANAGFKCQDGYYFLKCVQPSLYNYVLAARVEVPKMNANFSNNPVVAGQVCPGTLPIKTTGTGTTYFVLPIKR